jgi:drug/metabolite transporter (DMT)-like permease
MVSNWSSAGLSLGAAGSWGAGDFTGGVAAKQANAFRVVLVAHGAAMFLMVGLALALGEHLPPRAAVMYATAAGLGGGIALATFYRSLAVGKMGINAPIAGVLTAVIPCIYGAFTQGAPKPLQLAGFLIALIGIVLVSKPEGTNGRPAGVGLALIAGVGFGLFVIFVQLSGKSGGTFWPLAVVRVMSTAMMVLICAFGKQGFALHPRVFWTSALAGIFDSIGTAFLFGATRAGRLDISAVLASMYPVVTVVMARIFFKERLALIQDLGMLLALASVPMIAT